MSLASTLPRLSQKLFFLPSCPLLPIYLCSFYIIACSSTIDYGALQNLSFNYHCEGSWRLTAPRISFSHPRRECPGSLPNNRLAGWVREGERKGFFFFYFPKIFPSPLLTNSERDAILYLPLVLRS